MTKSITIDAVDPKTDILERLGDAVETGFEVFNNQVLVAVFIRPERTKTGLYLPDQSRKEDEHQGKVGLVVKFGPTAFDPAEEAWFRDVVVHRGDWVVFRPADGWALNLRGVSCRLIPDTAIRGRVLTPDAVW